MDFNDQNVLNDKFLMINFVIMLLMCTALHKSNVVLVIYNFNAVSR